MLWSVTSQHCIKTAKHMIAQQSRNDTIGTTFYDAKRLSENPMGYCCYFRLLVGSLEVVRCLSRAHPRFEKGQGSSEGPRTKVS